jgi:hypothetical protein
MARRVKFDGKVYKQTKFGEGLQPGTVEWEERKRQECADDREYRAMLKNAENRKRRPQSDLPRSPQFMLFRAIGSLIRLLRR